MEYKTMLYVVFSSILTLSYSNIAGGRGFASDVWKQISEVNAYDNDAIRKEWLNFNVVDKGIKPRRKAEFNVYRCGEYKLNNGQVIKQSTICQNS